jgi:putative nucleotidyltransferase with HDIG domain
MRHQITVLLGRATSHERAGDWKPALVLFEEAFSKSLADNDISGVIEAILRIGICHHSMGSEELSVEYLDLATELASIHDDQSRAARAVNTLAIVSYQRGELDTAEVMYHRARELAGLAGDRLTQGNIDLNLGILENIRGDLETALERYQSALEAYEQIGDQLRIARVLNNIGMLRIDLKQLDEAGECLDRALTISRVTGDLATEAIIQSNRTELFLELGELELARESCDHAFDISSRLNEDSVQSEALRFFGIIFRRTGQLSLAEDYLQQAVTLAAEKRLPLIEAEAQRELALALRLQGRNREALQALNQAHLLFSKLRAEHEQEDIDRRVAQLEEDFLSLVQMWGESIEAKDKYTSGHSRRVARYACQIGSISGIAEREMVWFRMGAFLHDIGKTEIPGEILNKPGRLTDEEREVVERHTIWGYEMLSSVDFPWDVLPMIRSHHERWDGRGYPDGLKGEQIPLTARILRIADVFDALTTNRSYRTPLSADQAFQIMENDDGAFDPEMFDIFRRLLPTFSEMVSGGAEE